ncbi:WD40 repeat domain-containing protein [Streptomyces sp. NPDC059096]|uniref:WD40 repeat domain-containing protein n=1 Tax=Streptomyces sp. NPDC059096 TaxID=3346727 RepID=UPI0036B2A967
MTAFAGALACLTIAVGQGVLTMPWTHEKPEDTIEQWRLVDRLWPGQGADALTFSPEDSYVLLTTSPKGLDSWELTDPEHPGRVSPGGHGVKSGAPLGVSPDGWTLVAADGRNVLGLRTDTGQRVWSITKPQNTVKAIHVSRHGVLLAVSDTTRFTQLQSASPGDADGAKTATEGQIPLGARAARFSPDGRTLAIATDDGTLHLWNIASSGGPRRVSPPFADENGGTTALAFSADGRLLATVGADHIARLWDVENPRHPHPLGSPLPNTPVTAVAFSGDPHLVATVGTDRTAYLWKRDRVDTPAR